MKKRQLSEIELKRMLKHAHALIDEVEAELHFIFDSIKHKKTKKAA